MLRLTHVDEIDVLESHEGQVLEQLAAQAARADHQQTDVLAEEREELKMR